MNRKRIINILIIVLGSLSIALFVIWNLLWFSYKNDNYKLYMNITQDTLVKNDYYSYKDGLSYSVKDPSYLKFNGNLGISDESQNLLLIFPKFKSDPIYCILPSDYNNSVPIIINKRGLMKENLEYPKEIRDSIIKNQKEIDALVRAFDEWTIAAKEGNNNYFKDN